MRSDKEITSKQYENFISIVSDNNNEKSEKKSIKLKFSKYEDKFKRQKLKTK